VASTKIRDHMVVRPGGTSVWVRAGPVMAFGLSGRSSPGPRRSR
jgi:hypothetical protein